MSSKSYACFFVCMATKANKIEVCSDLSSDSFLASSARFFIRRGLSPDVISADDGQNFVGTWVKSRSAFNPMKYMIRQTSSLPPTLCDVTFHLPKLLIMGAYVKLEIAQRRLLSAKLLDAMC